MKDLLVLWGTFFKIGAFTFGGGYAMLPMLQKEIVEKQKWATDAELMDYFAVGQVTPGVIAVNTATFIGYRQRKISGAIVATLGVIAPSLFLIILIAAFLSQFTDLVWVHYAFNGIRACVCVQIFEAVLHLSKSALVNRFSWLIFIVVLVLSSFSLVSSVLLVLLAGLSGVGIGYLKMRREG